MKIKFYIGCSGFYNKHWKGIFYPEDMPSSGWLGFYADKLNSLELNNTFYRFPGLKSMQNWYDKVPDDFRFSVKAPKIITHLKKLNDCEELLNDFYTVCETGLRHKLSCLLFQFPPGIAYSEEFLEKVLRSLKPGFLNVVEFRHESWWREDVCDIFRKRNIIFCSVSHPSLPDNLINTTKTAYIRLHGTPRMFYSDYSKDYLEELARQLIENKELEEVFVYFNNTAGNAGILNALDLQSLVSK
ncbi:MAG: hypothetical protein K0R65_1468 [Crocinitomicaceae bacterium]|jgi:uncharacterized protein YecE (DUF72 family)|nr:hypothetical protein [Crocinitomicaceae bacterium]